MKKDETYSLLIAAISVPTRADDDDAFERLAAQRAGLVPERRAEFDRVVEDLLPEGTDARERWIAACSRLAALDASSVAAAHFEHLTGFSIDGGAGRLQGRGFDSGKVLEPAVRRWRPRLWAAAAAVATIALTGVLGRVTEDPIALAAYRSLEARLDSRPRSPVASPVAGTASSQETPTGWAAESRGARSLRLGLWPVYDRDSILEIEHRVVAAGDSSGAALLLLGELRLMRGAVPEGVEAVTAAAAAGSEEARNLLERIR